MPSVPAYSLASCSFGGGTSPSVAIQAMTLRNLKKWKSSNFHISFNQGRSGIGKHPCLGSVGIAQRSNDRLAGCRASSNVQHLKPPCWEWARSPVGLANINWWSRCVWEIVFYWRWWLFGLFWLKCIMNKRYDGEADNDDNGDKNHG